MCYLKTCHRSRKCHLVHMILLDALFLTKLLFCTFLCFLSTADINLVRTLYAEAEQLGTVIDHLNKSAAHSKHILITVSILKTHLTGNDGSYNIRMMGKKSLLTIHCRDNKLLGTSCISQFIAGIDFQAKCLTHSRSLLPVLLGFRFCNYVINSSNIKECILRIIIHLAIDDCLKSTDGLFQWYVFTFDTGEVLSYMEWLGKELLDLSCTEYSLLIFL